MEMKLKSHILKMTQNANWAKEELPAMIEKGMRVLNSNKAQAAIAERGQDDVIHYVAYKLIDEYY